MSSKLKIYNQVRIACIGDSITFGWGMKNIHKNSYPALLQKKLGPTFRVANFGKSGYCVSKNHLKGKRLRSYFFLKEHKRARNFRPNLVFCNLGINDIMEFESKPKRFAKDYKELLETYRSLPSQPQIVVWNKLSPLFPGQAFYNNPGVDEINSTIAQVVEELNAASPNLKPILTIDMGKAMSDKENLYFPDKLHPNFGGIKEITQVTLDFMKSRQLL